MIAVLSPVSNCSLMEVGHRSNVQYYRYNPSASLTFNHNLLFLCPHIVTNYSYCDLKCIRNNNKQKAENLIEDINFDSPFNNTFSLGTPFLVDHDNTTGIKPIGIRTTDMYRLKN